MEGFCKSKDGVRSTACFRNNHLSSQCFNPIYSYSCYILYIYYYVLLLLLNIIILGSLPYDIKCLEPAVVGILGINKTEWN